MAIFSRDEAQALMKKALSFSKSDECEINFNGNVGGNIRYARNAVSTSGGISQSTMAISSAFGKKLGVVTLNEYDDKSIAEAVRLSEELAHLAPENPEYVPFMGPQTYGPDNPKLFDQKTADMTPKHNNHTRKPGSCKSQNPARLARPIPTNVIKIEQDATFAAAC